MADDEDYEFEYESAEDYESESDEDYESESDEDYESEYETGFEYNRDSKQKFAYNKASHQRFYGIRSQSPAPRQPKSSYRRPTFTPDSNPGPPHRSHSFNQSNTPGYSSHRTPQRPKTPPQRDRTPLPRARSPLRRTRTSPQRARSLRRGRSKEQTTLQPVPSPPPAAFVSNAGSITGRDSAPDVDKDLVKVLKIYKSRSELVEKMEKRFERRRDDIKQIVEKACELKHRLRVAFKMCPVRKNSDGSLAKRGTGPPFAPMFQITLPHRRRRDHLRRFRDALKKKAVEKSRVQAGWVLLHG
ncbi:hypothetical protein F4779DRAFT_574188 [Xylariaceae sp. FL0662B]|nr:hypothetical protein F4779DRAFT_574188 [Xylariaceae sp. FL0662B]